ncbi:NAD(P)-dependent oxidoreductase [Ramlibacter ginsenosidimutans]|uniref:NAD(P)-dependent oxidoreductase n=1 Tax=Ramlibacter ginsenosidimutans TaxID=502333 RepID=A0A934TRC2_9BURK|nr:NAD(P)-dependent oxidoreductase [Ramlibacter ginsenosidimutans]MBK6005925.1 NAD(P)-dependent oxidoreductase [Ramlibacter ginsenosidimutans]
MKLGIAGTGKMGSAIARRLLSLGHEVTVWNRTQERAQPLLKDGAKWAATPAAVTAASEAVITILTDAKALDDVYFGADGLLAQGAQGKLFIEMSTVPPAKQQEMGPRVKAKGASYVECPVGGTTGPAAQGKLFGFAGGDAQDLERAKDLLGQLCRRVEHVGGYGDAARMKLAINLPLMVYWQALGEALSLIEPLGLDPARIVDILADTSGGPNLLKVRGPAIAQALSGQDVGPASFDLASMRKDVKTMLEQGLAQHYRMPVTEQTLKVFEAAVAAGMKDADCTAVPVWWLQGAGKS